MDSFIEIGPRLYEVRVVPAPLIRAGRERVIYFDHDDQTVEISDSVPPAERSEVLGDGVNWILTGALPPIRWQLVPVLGELA